MAATPDSDDARDFTDVLTAWSWWDAPRSGTARIDGRPHRFRCDFDEALDDYPAEYQVWPITEDELAVDLAAWARWVAWRRRFDRGENPPPLESDPSWQAVVADARHDVQPPLGVVKVALPEWRLDPDRSFAARTPRHLVRFLLSEEQGPDTR